MPKSIRAQLSPLIREIGINEVARRTGINASAISNWINERPVKSGGPPRRMTDESIEKLAAAGGASWLLEKKPETTRAHEHSQAISFQRPSATSTTAHQAAAPITRPNTHSSVRSSWLIGHRL